jgi:hypothetical protein
MASLENHLPAAVDPGRVCVGDGLAALQPTPMDLQEIRRQHLARTALQQLDCSRSAAARPTAALFKLSLSFSAKNWGGLIDASRRLRGTNLLCLSLYNRPEIAWRSFELRYRIGEPERHGQSCRSMNSRTSAVAARLIERC